MFVSVSNVRRSLLFFFRTKLAFIYYFVSAGKKMISRFLLHWLLAVTADLWHRALAANIKNITV